MSTFVELPPEIARAVIDTVKTFARRQTQQHPNPPIEAKVWYHDEPLWYIRQEQIIPGGKNIVKRLQINAFKPSLPAELARLYIQPDVYSYNPGEVPIMLIDPDTVKKNSQLMAIYNHKGEALSYGTIRRNLRSKLSIAWDFITDV